MWKACYALAPLVLYAQTPTDAPPKIYTSIVITAKPVQPEIDQRNAEVFSRTLFSRDDQVFHVLDAGINAGQHEGGGKSVEIRRFGFNLDHGGVNGGLKVLVNNVQQNQATQGHGQGYLGSLKSVTPELIQEVAIINGPFSAEYGDFSGLGVVHIRLRDSLPDVITARVQAGSFGSARTFFAFSPELKNGETFVAYEGSRTDGPFHRPLGYLRDNVTGNYTRRLDDHRAIGWKFNASTNHYNSSGQIPIGEVDRFGYIDPNLGGNNRAGTVAMYYRRDNDAGGTLKADGFLTRSLFDLRSNFTGDPIEQHDSRLIEGANIQYQHPWRQSLFTAGGNYHDNQINVGIHARVTNEAGYLQQMFNLLNGRVQLGGGLRYDQFRFAIGDDVQTAGNWQPKASLAFTPSHRLPVTLHANYGRGISTTDARAIVSHPEDKRVATTDFYQLGTSHHLKRLSVTTDFFYIDRSNEMVYIPDDGTYEFKGPSHAYGFEAKASVDVTRHIAMNGGITKVASAFNVDSAPRFTANAGLTLANWRGWSGSLRLRAINHYALSDPAVVASGHTVIDFGLSRRITRAVEFNLSLDNLTNREYWETQNYFESRLPGQEPRYRIHGTPGYPLTVMAGLTFRLKGK